MLTDGPQRAVGKYLYHLVHDPFNIRANTDISMMHITCSNEPHPRISPTRAYNMSLLRLPRGSSTGLLLLGAAGVIGIGIAKSIYTGELICTAKC